MKGWRHAFLALALALVHLPSSSTARTPAPAPTGGIGAGGLGGGGGVERRLRLGGGGRADGALGREYGAPGHAEAEVQRLRGGSAYLATPQIKRAASFVTKTIEAEKGEILKDHKAALRARASQKAKPMLLQTAGPSMMPKEDSPAQGKMLSLVRPNYDEEDEGEVRDIEEASKFTAFKGSGHVLLSPDQLKASSPSQMHRLAVARLARMQQNMQQAQDGETQTDAAADRKHEAMMKAHFEPAPVQAKAAPVVHQPDFILKDTEAGLMEGVDEWGNAWSEAWNVNETTGLKYGHKQGSSSGGWQEDWVEYAPGQYLMEGSNMQGHMWGERWGRHDNGTAFKEKWLVKEHDGWEERTGWNEAGQTSGSRKGLAEDGTSWEEAWVQQIKEGVSTGMLTGLNEHGELWKEEWEVVPLNAFSPETGAQLMSTCGEKSGVDREGKIWSEAWGNDDLMGHWGHRSEKHVDGSEMTEHYGANLEGDVWCAKWGVTMREEGVKEEWGWKNGQKNVRIGQEMDGYTNMEEGKIETWTETWCKTVEDDGRVARHQAEKIGDNGFGDKWVEKWDEQFNKDGSMEKYASKYGKKDRTSDEWKEEWGERRAPPDEYDEHGRFLSCWAEKKGTNGYGDVWHDAWSEELDPMSGRGGKVCNKWKRLGHGKEIIERSGEEWDGKGWYQKGGETIVDGNKVDGWHDRAW